MKDASHKALLLTEAPAMMLNCAEFPFLYSDCTKNPCQLAEYRADLCISERQHGCPHGTAYEALIKAAQHALQTLTSKKPIKLRTTLL